MKRCCIAIALIVAVTGCDKAARSMVGPTTEAQQTPTEFFALSGRIGDIDGMAVAGARVQLTTDSTIQTTTSGAEGEYRFDNVRGKAMLRVSKEGFFDAVPFVYVDRDQIINIPLQRPPAPLLLVAGTPLHATVQGPPCDPVHWDARALCEQVSFTAPTSDPYEIVLTSNGASELDMLIDEQLYFEGSSELHALLPGAVGRQWVIRINSYYAPQAFTLTATPRPVP